MSCGRYSDAQDAERFIIADSQFQLMIQDAQRNSKDDLDLLLKVQARKSEERPWTQIYLNRRGDPNYGETPFKKMIRDDGECDGRVSDKERSTCVFYFLRLRQDGEKDKRSSQRKDIQRVQELLNQGIFSVASRDLKVLALDPVGDLQSTADILSFEDQLGNPFARDAFVKAFATSPSAEFAAVTGVLSQDEIEAAAAHLGEISKQLGTGTLFRLELKSTRGSGRTVLVYSPRPRLEFVSGESTRLWRATIQQAYEVKGPSSASADEQGKRKTMFNDSVRHK